MSQYCDAELLEAIINWSSTSETFDTSFVESLYEQIEKDELNELTAKQRKSVENIIEQFDIDVDEWI